MTIDWSKPVQTRDGRPVEIITTKGRDRLYPVMGYIADNTAPDHWDSKGRFYAGQTAGCPADLVNVPEERELWLNVNEGGVFFGYDTKQDAATFAGTGRIACVHVKYKVGEGLE